jgi:type IV pilus assembly protein PilQ
MKLLRPAYRWRWIAATAAIGLLVTSVSACSSRGGRPSASGGSVATGAATADDPFAVTAPPPVEIRALELRDAASGVELDVRGSGAMVWTSYRSADGSLVVELPNSSPGPELASLDRDSGLVATVLVEADQGGARPITRLTITTRADAEHALAADGNVLRLSLMPTTDIAQAEMNDAIAPAAEGAIEAEPVDAEPAEAGRPAERFVYEPLGSGEATAAQDTPASMPQLGTAENPVAGPAPVGPQASSLRDIEVLDDETILVAGDGEFAYSTFRLENPERFVVDLEGVVNTATASSMPVSGERLRRVRVAQFKPFPEPVTRVVFDLEEPASPQIERTTNGLVIRLAGLGAAPMQVAAAEPPPAPPEMATPEMAPPTAAEWSEPEPTMAAEATAPEAEAYDESGSYEPEAVEVEVADAQPMNAGMPMELDEPELAQPQPAPPMAEPEPAPRVAQAPPLPAPRVEAEPMPLPAESPTYLAEPARRAPQIPTSNDSELFDELPPEAPGGANFSARTFNARPIGGEQRVYTGDPISMSLRDADVVETLRSFASISDLSIVVQPEVSGSVTVELENVPWDQALEQILKMNRLGYEIEGTIMRIAPLDILRREAEERSALEQAKADQIPMQTIVKRLSYSTASEIATLLRQGGGLLSRRGSVIVDQRTNTLILKELPQYMDTVIAVIEEVDTPEPQVMIEARIIETTKRFTRTLGVSWSVSGEASPRFGNTTGLQFPNQIASDGGVNLLTGAANGFLNLSLGNVLNSFNLDVALQAAENEGLIKILSAPKIATLNNEQANIQSGLQIPVQTISNNTVTVQFINATLSLDVTPQVTAEGTVLMDIEIRKREPQLAFAVQGAANAPIATKEARTRVIVRDGGTTVIGGIYEVSSDQGEDRVPGLSNIPLLGHLFKNKRRSDENEELLIFITPRVINL